MSISLLVKYSCAFFGDFLIAEQYVARALVGDSEETRCRGVYRLGSLIIWTPGNLVVGLGMRLVVPVIVWEPLYLNLVRGFRESENFG